MSLAKEVDKFERGDTLLLHPFDPRRTFLLHTISMEATLTVHIEPD